uniref:VTT domain-containing protein n=2 Tax=Ditylum brightwellii TaxID=49249 RepID=A0A6S9ATL9_9STRA|mmetsp:Transcript_30789/g.44797  ORF Transcript_30789/g.44797 Transcript_30789/m.44797 type:complete len:468 (-) Transcript_30789:217-1620(-)
MRVDEDNSRTHSPLHSMSFRRFLDGRNQSENRDGGGVDDLGESDSQGGGIVSSSSSIGSKKRGGGRRLRLSRVRSGTSNVSDSSGLSKVSTGTSSNKSPPPSGFDVEMGTTINSVTPMKEEDRGIESDDMIVENVDEEYLESSPLHSAITPDDDRYDENCYKKSLKIEEEEKEEHIVLAVFHLILNRHWKKKLMTAVVFTSFGLVVVDLLWFGYLTFFLDWFLDWMKRNPVDGCLAFIGMFVLATQIFIPTTILTLGSGFVFAEAYGMGKGIYLATATCFLGNLFGAVLSFIRSRYMMRDLVRLFAKRYPLVRKFDSALNQKGFKIMFLLRLSSVVPFNALNYIGGITSVKLSSFVASIVGILPSIIVTVVIGATAENIKEGQHSEQHRLYTNVLLCLGCALGTLTLIALWTLAREHLEQNEDEVTKANTLESKETDTLSIQSSEAEDKEGPTDSEMEDEQWYWVWA